MGVQDFAQALSDPKRGWMRAIHLKVGNETFFGILFSLTLFGHDQRFCDFGKSRERMFDFRDFDGKASNNDSGIVSSKMEE